MSASASRIPIPGRASSKLLLPVLVLVLLAVLAPASRGQSGPSAALSLGSATAYAGGTVSLNLTLTPEGVAAGLQWTFSYSTSDFSAVQVVASAQTVNTGKSVICSSKTGSTTCVLVGLNNTNLAQGVVAIANVTLANSTPTAPASRTAALNIINPVGASTNGDPVFVSATGGAVTILKPSPVAVTPSSASLFAQQTQQFTADGSVLWSLSPAVGTITAAGRYTAPSKVSSAQQDTRSLCGKPQSSLVDCLFRRLQKAPTALSPSYTLSYRRRW